MLRFVNICLILGLVALATVIYQVKYEARNLDEKIVKLQRQIEAERDSLAVARAEWSLLNRPERIERLAEKYLELQPAYPQQPPPPDRTVTPVKKTHRSTRNLKTIPLLLPPIPGLPPFKRPDRKKR